MIGRFGSDELTVAQRAVDRGRLERLFDGEFDAVYRFCLARTGDAATADDAASEAFTAAARLFSAGRGDEVTRPWLFVVARNRMIDQWRAEARRERRMQRLIDLRRQQPADDITAVALRADAVLSSLASLSERQRAALTLRYLDEHSVSEVADRLGLSYQAAESLLARARRSFEHAWRQSNG
jgi:RNA polymerase sigma-70 factor (ECF subfamily)